MKNRKTRAKVLKSREKEITEDRKEEIIEELLESNKVSVGQLISYEEFKRLYDPYKKEIKEPEFADILGITYGNYTNIKNSSTRAKVLKSREKGITEDRKEEIIEELLESNKVSVGKLISYEEFKILYEPYKEEIKEPEFADILGITYSNYESIKKRKNRGKRAKVLKSREKKITEDRKEEIIEELLESNKVREGQLISYEEFKILYDPYKEEIKEPEFAGVLGISYGSYIQIKNRKTRTKVLKSREKEITEDRKEEIIQELLENNKVSVGQSISYEEFKILYEPYKEEIKEPEFADILGITYGNYSNIKYKKQRYTSKSIKE